MVVGKKIVLAWNFSLFVSGFLERQWWWPFYLFCFIGLDLAILFRRRQLILQLGSPKVGNSQQRIFRGIKLTVVPEMSVCLSVCLQTTCSRVAQPNLAPFIQVHLEISDMLMPSWCYYPFWWCQWAFIHQQHLRKRFIILRTWQKRLIYIWKKLNYAHHIMMLSHYSETTYQQAKMTCFEYLCTYHALIKSVISF